MIWILFKNEVKKNLENRAIPLYKIMLVMLENWAALLSEPITAVSQSQSSKLIKIRLGKF